MAYTDPNAFTYDARPGLAPGVWPKRSSVPLHFQLVGDNRRALVVGDMVGLIDVGGVHVTNPDDLDEMAERLRGLADLMRERAVRKPA